MLERGTLCPQAGLQGALVTCMEAHLELGAEKHERTTRKSEISSQRNVHDDVDAINFNENIF